MPTTLQPETPASANATNELEVIFNGAAFYKISDRSFLRITGPDAGRWLNGMVTNSIQDLQPGQGNYNFLLNAQGRIQGDCNIYREPIEGNPIFLLETTTDQLETIEQHLDKFIIMDDVELSREVNFDEQGVTAPAPLGVAVLGAKAADVLASTMMTKSESPMTEPPLPGTMVSGTHNGKYPNWVLSPPGIPLPSFEIWCSNPNDYTQVLKWLEQSEAIRIGEETLEHLRLLSGTPRYGTDIRNTEKSRDLPQETNQPHALNFTKGCYLGQEIVERIHSRGAVHRTLTGLLLTGPLPTPGTAIEADGKPVGEITSAASIPLPSGTIQLALAYLRREALAEAQAHKLTLTYPAGTATPIALPYSALKLSSSMKLSS
jgi:folate-binding protein YgfZ